MILMWKAACQGLWRFSLRCGVMASILVLVALAVSPWLQSYGGVEWSWDDGWDDGGTYGNCECEIGIVKGSLVATRFQNEPLEHIEVGGPTRDSGRSVLHESATLLGITIQLNRDHQTEFGMLYWREDDRIFVPRCWVGGLAIVCALVFGLLIRRSVRRAGIKSGWMATIGTWFRQSVAAASLSLLAFCVTDLLPYELPRITHVVVLPVESAIEWTLSARPVDGLEISYGWNNPGYSSLGTGALNEMELLGMEFAMRESDNAGSWQLDVPHRLCIPVFAIIPLLVLTRELLIMRNRPRTGCCEKCGYDLRMSSGHCPECGAVINAVCARNE